MAANFYLPHIWVLPEDDANRQIAVGFLLDPSLHVRAVDILHVAGGWRRVVETFTDVHIQKMETCPPRFMVLLLDFDEDAERYQQIRNAIPAHLSDRVFVIGTWSEPEHLKPDFGTLQDVGLDLARDCRQGTNQAWGHRLLQNNQAELQRMSKAVKSFLFP